MIIVQVTLVDAKGIVSQSMTHAFDEGAVESNVSTAAVVAYRVAQSNMRETLQQMAAQISRFVAPTSACHLPTPDMPYGHVGKRPKEGCP